MTSLKGYWGSTNEKCWSLANVSDETFIFPSLKLYRKEEAGVDEGVEEDEEEEKEKQEEEQKANGDVTGGDKLKYLAGDLCSVVSLSYQGEKKRQVPVGTTMRSVWW